MGVRLVSTCGHQGRVDAGRIGAAVVALAAGIGKEEAGSAGTFNAVVGGREKLAVLLALSPAGLEADGEGPFLRGIGLDAGAQEEALLRDRNLAVGRLAEGEERHAGLGDQALHDLVHRLVAGGGLRVPEVFGGGVRVEVGGEVVMHALAEGLRAEVVLDRQQHVAGLAVGDAVEHLVDFVGGVGLGADGAGGGLRVEVQRAVHVRGHGLVDVPLRMHGGDGLVLHPGGKAFVEPDVVPPLHGDQVAEPLVGHLVSDDQGHFFLGVDGGCFGIDAAGRFRDR